MGHGMFLSVSLSVSTCSPPLNHRHKKRTLLLVYPGPNEMALNCLKEYRGSRILYVGEPRGGVNANDEFFSALQKVGIQAQCGPLVMQAWTAAV